MHELERIRGKSISFMLVVINMKMDIREMTSLITTAYATNIWHADWNDFLLEELTDWLTLRNFGIKRK